MCIYIYIYILYIYYIYIYIYIYIWHYIWDVETDDFHKLESLIPFGTFLLLFFKITDLGLSHWFFYNFIRIKFWIEWFIICRDLKTLTFMTTGLWGIVEFDLILGKCRLLRLGSSSNLKLITLFAENLAQGKNEIFGADLIWRSYIFFNLAQREKY